MDWSQLWHSSEGRIVLAVTVISLVVAVGIKHFISRNIRRDAEADKRKQQDADRRRRD